MAHKALAIVVLALISLSTTEAFARWTTWQQAQGLLCRYDVGRGHRFVIRSQCKKAGALVCSARAACKEYRSSRGVHWKCGEPNTVKGQDESCEAIILGVIEMVRKQ